MMFIMVLRRLPMTTLFPYTTLFRSGPPLAGVAARCPAGTQRPSGHERACDRTADRPRTDRKSTRLNSSHLVISYAVFCLKKKTGLLPQQDLVKSSTKVKLGRSEEVV